MQGKSLIIAVQPARKISQFKFEQKERVFQGEGLWWVKQKSMIRKMGGVPYKKKKKGNYISFQIKVCMQKSWSKLVSVISSNSEYKEKCVLFIVLGIIYKGAPEERKRV